VTEWFDRFQQRHAWAGFPLAVVYKFVDDQGSYLAALITYYGFLSLFPLLLLLSSVLGFLLEGDRQLQDAVLHSALSQFPVIGDQLGDPRGLQGSTPAVVIGVIGLLYGALGVTQALQNAMNVAWAVPRNQRPNPLLSRVRSLALLGIGGLALLGTTVLSAVSVSTTAFGARVGAGLTVAATAAAIALNAAVVLLALRISTAHPVGLREGAPGAVLAAVAWQLLQSFGASYVGHVVKNASATNGVFALVLGLIAWLYLAAVALVICVEIDVVRVRHLYPRALLTPFTDDVDLTRADKRAYAGYATAQRAKGFETVEVAFEHDGRNASARGRDETGQSATASPDDRGADGTRSR
jgi:YihY family inner membrane protein